jgi:hypothetical protein
MTNIGMDFFYIAVFINHRPFNDITESDLLEALTNVNRFEPSRLNRHDPISKAEPNTLTHKTALTSLLQQYGKV